MRKIAINGLGRIGKLLLRRLFDVGLGEDVVLINDLNNDEKKNYMQMIGLKEIGLDMLIQKGYEILELDTFFTSGLSTYSRIEFE